MANAHHQLYAHMGSQRQLSLLADRFEAYSGDGGAGWLWDADVWYGGDIHKVWLKSAGEQAFDAGDPDAAEVQLLYSRAVSPYFDLQAGLRQDSGAGPSTTHGVLGVQGLAPYFFDVDAAIFVSDDGDLTGRGEFEYELLLTPRLVAQPRLEIGLSAQDIVDRGVGSGITEVTLGLRVRYQLHRSFAPYIGIAWQRRTGGTAEFARDAGDDVERLSAVFGIRFWI